MMFALVVLAGFLAPVSALLAFGVGCLAYVVRPSGTESEDALMAILIAMGAIGVAYTIAKGLFPSLP